MTGPETGATVIGATAAPAITSAVDASAAPSPPPVSPAATAAPTTESGPDH
ncbi:hypothetical protein [Streptomyces sp. x-80]|uniref:hypothetical protein n=1 Tax=Streptomyces sp. x-80 TaxID=2789282 RepID=UPI00398162A6